MKFPEIIPVTDLRQDAAAILKKLQDSPDPLVVTQRGRAIAVIQSVDAYEKSEHERALLRILAIGEKEIDEGKRHSLSSVLKEADALLRDEEKREWNLLLQLAPNCPKGRATEPSWV